MQRSQSLDTLAHKSRKATRISLSLNLVLLGILTVLLPSAAQAAGIYVNDSSITGDIFTSAVGNDSTGTGIPGAPYATVSRALQDAFPGDTIFVDAGTYAETVAVDTAVTITGAGNAATSFDFQDSTLITRAIAFSVSGLIGITIKDLAVTNYYLAIEFQGVTNSTLQNLLIHWNGTGGGIKAGSSSDSNTIDSNVVEWNNDTGIIVDASNSNTVSNNTLRNNTGDGIRLSSASSNTLSTNTASNNGFDGIILTGSNNNTLTGNTSTANGSNGISLSGSSFSNTLTSNATSSNSTNGLAITGSNSNSITSHSSSSNLADGIAINTNSDSNLIKLSNTFSNGSSGFNIQNSNGNEILDNEIKGDGLNGIQLTDADLTVIANNLVNAPSNDAIHMIGTSNTNRIEANQIDSPGGWGVVIGGTASGNIVRKNNYLGSTQSSDSGVHLLSTGTQNLERNWWGTTDSVVISGKISNSGGAAITYIPFRLNTVDTTVGADTVAPSAPDTVAAVGIDSARIQVSWAGSGTNEEPTSGPVNLTGYDIYRSQNPDTPLWTKIAILGNTLNFIDTALAPSTTYFYRVTTRDSSAPFANESFYSDSIPSGTTLNPAPGPNIWYVNDSNLVGDVFTSSAGTPSNDGLSSATPKRFLGDLAGLLTPGDTVLIDAGTYLEADTVTFDTNNLTIRGVDSNVTIIDFNDSTLTGHRSFTLFGVTGGLISDLRVTNMRTGIRLISSNGVTVERVRATFSGNIGFLLTSSSSNNLLQNNAATNNAGEGFRVESFSTNDTLMNNLAVSNGLEGFAVQSNSTDILLSSNTSTNNASHGFSAKFSSDSVTFSNNTSSSNNGAGFSLQNVRYNDVVNNTASANNVGVGIVDGGINTVSNNLINNSDSHGLRIVTSGGNRVLSNRIENDSGSGIALSSGADTNIITSNQIRLNLDYGVFLNGSANNIFTQNQIDSNFEYQVKILVAAADTFRKNNIIPSSTNPDSFVFNNTLNGFDMRRNWWNTTDSALIVARRQGPGADSILYYPFRLDVVDTAPGADTAAPALPSAISVDTSTPGQVTLNWTAPTTDEENSVLTVLAGYQIYRAAAPDTNDWKPLEIAETPDTFYTDTGVTGGQTYYYRVTSHEHVSDPPGRNESFFGPSIEAFVLVPPAGGPFIFVNDADTTNDSFTQNVGSDSTGDGSETFPYRTIMKALSFASSGDTIKIDAGTYAETVTLDTDGLWLIGADSNLTIIDPGDSVSTNSFGIDASNRTLISISGLKVTNAYNGIEFNGTTQSIIENVSSISNGFHGIHLHNGAQFVFIRNNYIQGNGGHGILLSTTDSSAVDTNIVLGNLQDGIRLDTTVEIRVSGNSVTGNSSVNLRLFNADSTLVSENEFWASAVGVRVEFGSSVNELVKNIVKNNTVGIRLDGASNTVLRSNLVTGGSGNAIELMNATDNLFEQNEIFNHSSFQIWIDGTSQADTFVKNNIRPPTGTDSAVFNNTANVFDGTRNWWGTTDSAAILSGLQGTGADSLLYYPFRLGQVDTAPGADTVAPNAPDSVSASVLSDTALTVTWSASAGSEDPEAAVNLTNYRVYRSLTPDTSLWTQLATLPASETTYVDSGLTINTPYFYRITALDNWPMVNESFFSDSTASETPVQPNVVVMLDTPSPASGNIAAAGEDQTIVMAFTVAGNPSGDTLSSVTVRLTGPAGSAANVDTLALWQDANKNGTLEVGIDNLKAVLLNSGTDTFAANPNSALSAAASGADSFLVVLTLADTTTVGDTVRASIPANAVTTALTNPGPSAELASADSFTVILSTTEVFVDPAKPTGALVNPSGFDLTGMIAVSVGGNANDTLVDFRVGFTGPAGDTTSIDTAFLYRDANKNALFDSGVDTLVQTLSHDGISFLLSAPISLGLAGEDSFIVAISMRDTALAGDTFRARIPVGGVKTAGRDTAPANTNNAPGVFQIDSGSANLRIDIDPSTPSDTLSPKDVDQTRIMAFTIEGDAGGDTLQNLRINLRGTAGALSRLDIVSLYRDSNKNGDFDSGTDVLLTNLGYTGSGQLYGRDSMNVFIDATGRDSFLLVVSLKDTTPSGETIQAEIPAFNIVVDVADSGPTLTAVSSAIFTVFDQIPPDAFSLALPAANHDTNVSAVGLSWNASSDGGSGLKEYRIEISTDSTFGTINVSDTSGLTTAYITTPLPVNSWHYWRVFAIDVNGNEQPSNDTFSFRIDTTPPTSPSLVNPAANHDTTNTTIRFDWSASSDTPSGVESYRLQITTDSSFGTIDIDSQVANDTSAVRSLTAGQIYFWRIRVQDKATNSTNSDTRKLTVAGNGPVPPALLSPAAGHDTNILTVLFDWSDATDSFSSITEYRLQIDTANSFTSLVADSSTTLDTLGTHTFALQGTFFWRVATTNGLGQQTFSASRELVVDTSVTVSLFSPADNSTTSDTRPTFIWSSDGDTFLFELATDTSGGSLIETAVVTATSFQPDSTVGANTYFWRVIGRDNATNQDTTAHFRIVIDTGGSISDSTAPDTFNLVSPAHDTQTGAETLTFMWEFTTDSGSGIAFYNLQVASDTAFDTNTAFAVDSNTASTQNSLDVKLSGETLYFWRVIAFDNAGNGRISNTIANAVRTLFFDGIPPDSPAPHINPGAAAETSATTITFVVSTVEDTFSGIAQYLVQVDSSGAFTSPNFSGSSTDSMITISAMTNGTWFWRAAVRDASGNFSAWTAADTFRISTSKPSVPTPIFPISDTAVSSTTISFDWTDETGTVSALRRYRLKVTRDSSFASIDFDTLTADTTSSLSLPGMDTGQWYWLVQSEDQAGNISDSSATASFLIDVEAPGTVILSAPTNGSATRNRTVSFSWTLTGTATSSGLNGYNLNVVSSATGAAIVDSYFATSATGITVNVAGFNDTIYTAKVRARSNAGIFGAFSTTSTFTVDSTPPSAVPALVSPVGGAETTATSITFRISAASDTLSGVARYRFQAATDSTFGTVDVDVLTDNSDATFVPLHFFTDSNVTYFWRAAAIDSAGNQGPFGGSDSFVKPAPPDTTPPVPVANLSAIANDALGITVSWDASSSADMSSGGGYNVYWNEGRNGSTADTPLKMLTHTGMGRYTYDVHDDKSLTHGTEYLFKVKAQDRNGNEEQNNATLGAVARFGAANMAWASLITPQPGRRVQRTGGIQVVARIEGSARNFSETMTFQFRALGAAGWSDMTASSNAASINPRRVAGDTRVVYGMHWNAIGDGTTDTTYQIRVLMTDQFGNKSDSLSSITQITLVSNAAEAEIAASVADDTAEIQHVAYHQQSDTIYAEGNDSSAPPASLTFDSAALDTTGRITIQIQKLSNGQGNSFGAIKSAEIQAAIGTDSAVGPAFSIDLGAAKLNNSKTAKVTLPYPRLNDSGVIPGTNLAPESLVVRAGSNGDTRSWSWDSAANTASVAVVGTHGLFSLDTAAQTITVLVDGFSTFLLVAPADPLFGPGNQQNLNNFLVYPNPYRPNDGNNATGRKFDPANDRQTGIIFDNLPGQVRVQVFTMLGEQVFDQNVNVNRGYVTWNVRNQTTAREVGSGYYIYVVTNVQTGQKVTGKLAVIR